MNRFLVFCLSVVFCFYVYSNIGMLYPIQIQYGKSAPHMNVRSFFNHKVRGWGVVKKWNGIVRNKIYIDIEGSWIDNIGIINQNIEFDDGDKINLTWRIKMLDKNAYAIVASHCADSARGQQHGNMNIFTCKVVKERGGSIGDYTFETVMYMVDRHNILATTKIKRYGFLIGSAMFNLQQDYIE